MWAEEETATLTGTAMLEGTSPSTSYADHTTGVTDDKGNVYKGRWTYQKSGSTYYNMIQIKKTESSNSSRIELPKFDGTLKTITLTVTDASSTSSEGTGAKTTLAVVKGTTYTTTFANSNTIISAGSSSTATTSYVFDFTTLDEEYDGSGLYICSKDAAARIWSITATYKKKSASSVAFATSAPSITFPATSTYSQSATAAQDYDGTITYALSENTCGATIEGTTVTVTQEGSVKVTATAPATSSYSESTASYVLTVTDSREDAGLLVGGDFEMEVTTAIDVEDLYLAESDGELTVTSANPAVVKVENGFLKALSVGSSVITVSIAGTDDYAAASGQFTVTVTAKDGVEPLGPSSTVGKFAKVTSATDIEDGDYLIVYEDENVAFDGSLTTLDAASNTISITLETDGSITETTETKAAIFTLDTSDNSFKSASGYYIGISSYGNGLKQSGTTPYEHNDISFDEDGNVIISTTFTNGDMVLNFNANKSDKRFRYYKDGGQKAIQLYKYVAGTQESTFDVTVGEAKWRTMVSSKNVTLPEGLTAYIVTASSASSATLTAVSKVKANTAVLLNGKADDYTLTVTEDEVTYSETNLLQVSTESTGNGVYVLANKDDVVGFYLWKGGSLGAGRVYLPAPAGAREFIGFGEESTGISASLMNSGKVISEIYDLQGRRVAQPVKGLYIVNGKKVIIK